jgi:hypothetical protein
MRKVLVALVMVLSMVALGSAVGCSGGSATTAKGTGK